MSTIDDALAAPFLELMRETEEKLQDDPDYTPLPPSKEVVRSEESK